MPTIRGGCRLVWIKRHFDPLNRPPGPSVPVQRMGCRPSQEFLEGAFPLPLAVLQVTDDLALTFPSGDALGLPEEPCPDFPDDVFGFL